MKKLIQRSNFLKRGARTFSIFNRELGKKEESGVFDVGLRSGCTLYLHFTSKQHIKKQQPRDVLEIGCCSLVCQKLEIYLLRSSFFSQIAGLGFATLLKIEYVHKYFSLFSSTGMVLSVLPKVGDILPLRIPYIILWQTQSKIAVLDILFYTSEVFILHLTHSTKTHTVVMIYIRC